MSNHERRFAGPTWAEVHQQPETWLSTLGKLVGIIPENCDASIVDEVVPTMAASLPDYLRTPFDIVYAQMLAYHLSVRAGLDPDHPSPGGVITRVVQGFRLYPD